MTVLVTGGAGYIGSHAVQRLLRDGRRVVVLDNLHRGHEEPLRRLGWPGENTPGSPLVFARGECADAALVERLIREHAVTDVMHFAALAYVGESVDHPLWYYRNNAGGTLGVLEGLDAAARAGQEVRRFVFSSTCATYGEPPPERIPIRESCPQEPINPYGRSKLHSEQALADYAALRARQNRPFAYACPRYFNVAGCDRSGVLGEDHTPETHLIPVILQAALGQRESVTIFGNDYATPDGTCVRDYVHVEDLVDAHVAILGALKPGDARVYNLGIGKGLSVREIVDAARRVTKRNVSVREGPRRPGDPPVLYADPSKVRAELGWSAAIGDIDQVIDSAWSWMRRHPRGYRPAPA